MLKKIDTQILKSQFCRQYFQLSDSDEGYTPLQRPEMGAVSVNELPVLAQSRPSSGVPQAQSDSDEEDNYLSTETSDDSDTPANNLMAGARRKKKRKEVKVKPMKPIRPVGRVRPEKYNVRNIFIYHVIFKYTVKK